MTPAGPEATLRLLKLILGSMVAVIVLFAGVERAVLDTQPPAPELQRTMLIVLASSGVAILLAYFFVPRVMLASQRNARRPGAETTVQSPNRPPPNAPDLSGAYLIYVLIPAALAEALALLGIIVAMQTRRAEAYGAVVLGVVGILAKLPSRGNYDQFVAAVSGSDSRSL